jgi:hypothetical protein
MTVVRRGWYSHRSQALWTPPPASIDHQWVLVRTLRYTVALFALLLPEEASDVSFAMAVCSSALSYNVTLTLHMG